jgi:hypothetical protein
MLSSCLGHTILSRKELSSSTLKEYQNITKCSNHHQSNTLTHVVRTPPRVANSFYHHTHRPFWKSPNPLPIGGGADYESPSTPIIPDTSLSSYVFLNGCIRVKDCLRLFTPTINFVDVIKKHTFLIPCGHMKLLHAHEFATFENSIYHHYNFKPECSPTPFIPPTPIISCQYFTAILIIPESRVYPPYIIGYYPMYDLDKNEQKLN